MNPHYLTLGQAVKHVQCSKATLSKALNKGDLSGAKQPDGSWRIDPAELMRWNSERSTRNTKNQSQTVEQTSRNPLETLPLLEEIAALKAKLETLETATARERSRLVDQVDDLKTRLDAEQEERRNLSARLLPPPEQDHKSPKSPRGWPQRLAGLFRS